MSEIIPISPAPIAPERQTADRVALYDALLSLKTRDELDAFLNDLCTPAELRAFAERWAVARLLDQKTKSYREIALGIIERFSAAGVAVSIDDYGSGLSSLAYLKRIKADELKIDKAFILTLDESSRDALLVKSTIDLAHSLGMTITAEGVETPTALALLRGMGCDTAQGYLIAKPLPLAGLIERLGKPAVEAATKARATKAA